MRRRDLLWLLAATPLAWVAGAPLARQQANATNGKGLEAIRQGWKALLPADADIATDTDPLELSEDAWRARLGEKAFEVLREEDTEPSGSSPLNGEKRPGVYVCAGCALPLFSSEMKFDSGTGWPSFFTHIQGHLATKRDFKLFVPRTEYHCIKCGGHQGHVFDDGPPPTGERWCNNGVALRFVPAG